MALVAFFAAAANLVAAVAMLLVLAPGLPAGDSALAERAAYVSDHVGVWRAGWFLWHLAAIGLLALFVGLATMWREDAPILTRLALLCAGAGLAADLAAEAILMGVSPRLGLGRFAIVEEVGVVLTGYLGNGLYTVAGILLTWSGRRILPRPLLILGAAVWAAGLVLSAATMEGESDLQFASTATLMPLFVAWAFLLGTWLRRSAS